MWHLPYSDTGEMSGVIASPPFCLKYRSSLVCIQPLLTDAAIAGKRNVKETQQADPRGNRLFKQPL